MAVMKRVCLGGTFDVLHAGHARLLEAALAAGEALVIGLASDEFAASRRSPGRELAPYGEREAALRELRSATHDSDLECSPAAGARRGVGRAQVRQGASWHTPAR